MNSGPTPLVKIALPDGLIFLNRSSQLWEGGCARKWGLKRLRVLKLDRCPLLTDADIYHAVAGGEDLKALSLQGAPEEERLQEQVRFSVPATQQAFLHSYWLDSPELFQNCN